MELFYFNFYALTVFIVIFIAFIQIDNGNEEVNWHISSFFVNSEKQQLQ